MPDTIMATLERLRTITELDMDHKSTAEIMLSLNEEVGELAREIKVEERQFGNAHKTPSKDGSIGEAIDVIIMGFALYYARHAAHHGRLPLAATAELVERINKKLDKWAASQQVAFPEQVPAKKCWRCLGYGVIHWPSGPATSCPTCNKGDKSGKAKEAD